MTETHRRWQRTVATLLAELTEEIGDRVDDSAVASLAHGFCQFNDDQQAKFFVEVVRIAETWDQPDAATKQAYAIGHHLKTCTCATKEARDFIQSIAYGIGAGTT